jgi:hypothetical protein
VPPERFDLVDGFSTRSARDVFGYADGWGLPPESDRAAIRALMERARGELVR